MKASVQDITLYTYIYYLLDLKFTSWEEQNLDEARVLLQAQEHVHRAVIMGDLNGGPAVPEFRVSSDFNGNVYLCKLFVQPSYTLLFTQLLYVLVVAQFLEAKRKLLKVCTWFVLKNHLTAIYPYIRAENSSSAVFCFIFKNQSGQFWIKNNIFTDLKVFFKT